MGLVYKLNQELLNCVKQGVLYRKDQTKTVIKSAERIAALALTIKSILVNVPVWFSGFSRWYKIGTLAINEFKKLSSIFVNFRSERANFLLVISHYLLVTSY